MNSRVKHLRYDPYRDRMNASSLARHYKLILRFAVSYGPQATDALDDVLSAQPCENGAFFTSPMYEDAWALIRAVGPDAADLIGSFVTAYQERQPSNGPPQ